MWTPVGGGAAQHACVLPAIHATIKPRYSKREGCGPAAVTTVFVLCFSVRLEQPTTTSPLLLCTCSSCQPTQDASQG